MLSKICLGLIAIAELVMGIYIPVRLIGEEERKWYGWRRIPFAVVCILNIVFYILGRSDLYFNWKVWLFVDAAFVLLFGLSAGKHSYMMGTISILQTHILVAIDYAVCFALMSNKPNIYTVEKVLYDTPMEIIWIGLVLRAVFTLFFSKIEMERKVADVQRNRLALAGLDIISFLFCLFLGWQFVMEQTGLEINYLYIVLLMLCIFGFAFVLYDFIANNQKRQEFMQYRNRSLEQNYQYLYEEQRHLSHVSHDFKNHVNLLIRYLEEGRYEDALQYSQKLREPIQNLQHNSWSGHKMLDMILNMKAAEAKKNHIEIRMEIQNIRNVPMLDYDLCVIVSNLVDNAVEAVVHMEGDKTIRITVGEQHQMFLFKIVNPIDKEPKKRGEKYQTTKKQHGLHGLGLESVQASVDKYHGTLRLKHNEKEFEAVVMVPMEQKNKEKLRDIV